MGNESSTRASIVDRFSTLLVAVAAALWVSDAYFRPALVRDHLSAAQIVFAEDLLISLCFAVFAARVVSELHRTGTRRVIALCAIAAGPQAFATVLFTHSLAYAFPAGGAPDLNVENEVYLLYLLQPFFAVAGARLFLGERRRPYFWPLAALAAAGVYLIVFPVDPLSPFSSLQHGQLAAGLLVIGAVALWASGTVLGRYVRQEVSFLTTTTMRFVAALPILLILMLLDHSGAGYSVAQLPSFLAIALVPGLLSMLLYYRALGSTPASLATIAELAYPCTLFLVFSVPSPVGLGAPMHPAEILGAVALVVAVTSLNLLQRRVVEPAHRPDAIVLAEAAAQ